MTVNVSVFELQLFRPILRSLTFFRLPNAQNNHFFSNLIYHNDAKLSDEQLPTVFIVKNAPQMEI